MPFSHIRFHVVECNASFSYKQIIMIRYGFLTVYMGTQRGKLSACISCMSSGHVFTMCKLSCIINDDTYSYHLARNGQSSCHWYIVFFGKRVWGLNNFLILVQLEISGTGISCLNCYSISLKGFFFFSCPSGNNRQIMQIADRVKISEITKLHHTRDKYTVHLSDYLPQWT